MLAFMDTFGLIVGPEKREGARRPAAFAYARFWLFVRALGFAGIILQLCGRFDVALCLNGITETLIFSWMQPLVCWHCFVLDTAFWLGSFTSVDEARTQSNADVRSPLLQRGVQISLSDAQDLARTNVVSSTRVFGLDDISINMKTARLLGGGSSAKVYPGKINGIDVAVKLYFFAELDQNIISRFVSELNVMHAVAGHKNILTFYGAIVAPPAMGVVTEVCASNMSEAITNAKCGVDVSIDLSIGAARGVVALHEMGFIHGDVKSSNFLLAKDGTTVKLADLETAICMDQMSMPLEQFSFSVLWCAPELLDQMQRYDNGLSAIHRYCLPGPRKRGMCML